MAGMAKGVERIFLSICVVYLSYVISAFLAKLPSGAHRFAPSSSPAIDALHPDGPPVCGSSTV